MAQCSQCKTETELHHSGIPICPRCSDFREDKTPQKQQSARESVEMSAQSSSAEYAYTGSGATAWRLGQQQCPGCPWTTWAVRLNSPMALL
jgi:hypothetical protein